MPNLGLIMLNSNKLFLLAIVVMVFSACDAGSGEGLDINGQPLDGNNGTVPLDASLSSIQANVFDVSCAVSGCHAGAAAPQGLRLEADYSFDHLVNQASGEVPSLFRVEPFTPDDSYLIHKLEGTASVGVQMPRNQPPLPSETIDVIRTWIADGALGPTLDSIQAVIFTPVCTQCHFGSSPAGNLNLEEGNSYDNLVGVQREFDPEIRVVAGDADSSFLIDKLEGNNLGGSRGDRMPLNGPPYLTQIQIDAIRQWINAGAMQ